ncbi:MAG: alkaline phosphatase PhoX [Solirubrobacteraceae bacterium]
MNTRIAAGAALLCGTLAGTAALASAAAPEGLLTSVKPYVKPIDSGYRIKPLISVGDQVPETSHPAARYRMVGIPDGLGARHAGGGKVELFMNHELGNTVTSEPDVGGPANRGAFVSKFTLGRDGSVLSGERAYDTVFRQNTKVGPAPDATNSTPGFARFCSGALADANEGFDQAIYPTGEEGGGAATFDGRGGQSVAVFANEVHTLPKMGRFPKENTIILPGTGRRTVAFPTEDGPAGPESQLYMYVGLKQRHARTVLGRNGLDNGRLYVLVLDGHQTEADLVSGQASGHWVEIPDADTMTEAELEAAVDAEGAFGFVRIEDAAAAKRPNGDLYFVTTGGSVENKLGRIYRLQVDPRHPLRGGRLEVLSNADQVIAAGGDTAISPDNIDTSGQYLMVNEDGTAESRPVMAAKGRDGSVWRFDLRPGRDFQRFRVAQLNPPGRDGVAVGPGVWETSGIIDSSGLFGAGSWLYDVQAHPPTAAPGPGTVEDGQLVLMERRRR